MVLENLKRRKNRMSISVHCDVSSCKNHLDSVQSDYNPGKGWNRISMTVPRPNTRAYHVCPDCSKKLGLEPLMASKDPGQELLDIIYDMVQEEISNSRE